MTGTCGNRNSSTSFWNKCHLHHKSCFWTSTVPNKLPTNPTSPEPVHNDDLFWASVNVSEFLLSEREIRWRDPMSAYLSGDERVRLAVSNSITDRHTVMGVESSHSFLFDSLQHALLFCHTHSLVLSPSIRPLSFRHSKHDLKKREERKTKKGTEDAMPSTEK